MREWRDFTFYLSNFEPVHLRTFAATLCSFVTDVVCSARRSLSSQQFYDYSIEEAALRFFSSL